MQSTSLLSGAFALALLLLFTTSPVDAHHKPGHQGGPPHGEPGGPPGQRGRDESDSDGPFVGPGNSGAARWCRTHYADNLGAPFPFKNRGQCVEYFARGGTIDDDDNNGHPQGNLTVTELTIGADGRFGARGTGAEDRVVVWVPDRSERVVAFGQDRPSGDGAWQVQGEWGCQDSDDPELVELRIGDSDERIRLTVTFPCNELDD